MHILITEQKEQKEYKSCRGMVNCNEWPFWMHITARFCFWLLVFELISCFCHGNPMSSTILKVYSCYLLLRHRYRCLVQISSLESDSSMDQDVVHTNRVRYTHMKPNMTRYSTSSRSLNYHPSNSFHTLCSIVLLYGDLDS